MAGTIRVEVQESVDGNVWIHQDPDAGHNIGVGVKMVDYTATPGVRYARVVITEEGVGHIGVSCIAGIM